MLYVDCAYFVRRGLHTVMCGCGVFRQTQTIGVRCCTIGLYRVSPKKLTLLNSVYQIKNIKIFGKFSYVWMAEGLIYHMTPKKSENNSCLGEHWPLL